MEPPPDRPVRACRTQPGKTVALHPSTQGPLGRKRAVLSFWGPCQRAWSWGSRPLPEQLARDCLWPLKASSAHKLSMRYMLLKTYKKKKTYHVAHCLDCFLSGLYGRSANHKSKRIFTCLFAPDAAVLAERPLVGLPLEMGMSVESGGPLGEGSQGPSWAWTPLWCLQAGGREAGGGPQGASAMGSACQDCLESQLMFFPWHQFIPRCPAGVSTWGRRPVLPR